MSRWHGALYKYMEKILNNCCVILELPWFASGLLYFQIHSSSAIFFAVLTGIITTVRLLTKSLGLAFIESNVYPGPI